MSIFSVRVLCVISISCIIVMYQNCSEGFKAMGNGELASRGPASPGPGSGMGLQGLEAFGKGRFEPNCMDMPRTDFNACVSYKNPTYHAGSVLMPSVVVNLDEFFADDTGNLELYGLHERNDLLTYAVMIPGNSISNSTFQIEGPLSTTPTNGDWRFGTKENEIFHQADVNLYYWLNRQMKEVKGEHGSFYVEDKAVKVESVVLTRGQDGQGNPQFYVNASWSGLGGNSLSFGVTLPHAGSSRDATEQYGLNALAAEIAAHEVGHAI